MEMRNSECGMRNMGAGVGNSWGCLFIDDMKQMFWTAFMLSLLKKVFWTAFMLSLLILPIFAQQIQLPDETIIGNVSIAPDTLSISKDLSEYHNIAHPERLAYKTILNKDLSRLDYDKFNAYLYLKANTLPMVDARVGLLSNKVPELNFFASWYSKNTEYEDSNSTIEYNTQKISFDWTPLVHYGDLRFRPALAFKQAEIEWLNPNNIYSPEKTKQATSISISAISEPLIYDPLKKMSVRGDFISHKYDELQYGTDEDSSIELDVNIAFSEISYVAETDMTAYFKFDKIHYEGFFFVDIPFLDKLALNLQFSDGIMPSLYASKKFKTSMYSDITLANLPYLNAKSLYDYHESFLLAPISVPNLDAMPKVWINLIAAFNLHTPVEMQISYNLVATENYSYLNRANESIESEYLWHKDDVTQSIFELDLRKQIEDYSIGFNSKYMLSNCAENDWNLPIEPHFTTAVNVEYKYKRFTFGLSGTYLMDRYNGYTLENQEVIQLKMPDVFILSSHNSFNINKNFKLSLNINNILNQDYYKVSELTKEGFNAEIVGRVLF